MQVSLRVDERAWADVQRRLSGMRGAAIRAAVSALNRAAEGVRTDEKRAAGDRFTAPVGKVAAAIRLHKASRSVLSAAVDTAGKRLRLAEFRVTPKSAVTTGPGGKARRPSVRLTAEVRRGTPRPVDGPVFAGRLWGQLEIGRRLTRRRFPVSRELGPSPAEMLGEADVWADLQARGAERLRKALAHEVRAFLTGARSV